MKIETHQVNDIRIAEVVSADILIKDPQDALDLLMDLSYQDFSKIILYERNFTPAFLDLSTGLAGEILQKCSNYHLQLGVVGDFAKFTSKSLSDFIYESNKRGQINFAGSLEEAKERLSKN